MSDLPIEPEPTDEELQEELSRVAEQEGSLNLTDPRAQRRQRKRVDNETELASKFWCDVFSHPVGRREMWRMLTTAQSDGNPFTPPFACGPNGFPQPDATWFRAGQYALGQHFYQTWMQQAGVEAVKLMLDEHDPRFAKRGKSRQPK